MNEVLTLSTLSTTGNLMLKRFIDEKDPKLYELHDVAHKQLLELMKIRKTNPLIIISEAIETYYHALKHIKEG